VWILGGCGTVTPARADAARRLLAPAALADRGSVRAGGASWSHSHQFCTAAAAAAVAATPPPQLQTAVAAAPAAAAAAAAADTAERQGCMGPGQCFAPSPAFPADADTGDGRTAAHTPPSKPQREVRRLGTMGGEGVETTHGGATGSALQRSVDKRRLPPPSLLVAQALWPPPSAGRRLRVKRHPSPLGVEPSDRFGCRNPPFFCPRLGLLS